MASPVMPLPLRDGDRLTREEFLRRWDAMPDVMWAELIDGVVYMPSPVSRIHGDFHVRLTLWLASYDAATPGLETGADGTWLMSDDSVPQPDLASRILWEYGGQSRVEGEYPAGAPELIVELSHTTGSRDSGAKRKLYERSGVREYLIVRPKRRQIAWQELVDGQYREMAPDADGIFRSHVFPGLWLNAEALWTRDLSGLTETVRQGTGTAEHERLVRQLAQQKR